MTNIDFSNLHEALWNSDAKFDIWNKSPTINDINNSLWARLWVSNQVISNKENLYREDIEFKEGVSRCIAFFENLDWKDLTMCSAYIWDVL